MKKLLMCILAGAVLAASAGAACAAIGWAGNIWPVNGNVVPEGTDVGVYFQIWKDGVTNNAGQGAGISAMLYYGPDGGPYTAVAMTFNVDVGSNDEYTANIPVAALEGKSEIWFYCEAYDSTDASTYTGAQDQNSNDPPFMLNITPVLNRDVTVYFRICLPPDTDPAYDPAPGNVCVIGDAAQLTAWGSGVVMPQPCAATSPQFYEIGIVFPAGSNPAIQYKYKKNDCNDWESVGNRSVFIDDSDVIFIMPWVDHWDNYEGDDCPICGVGTEDSTWGGIKQIYR